MSIWLNDGKRTDDLRKEFRSYLSVDMLLCFTQASPWESPNVQKKTREPKSEPGKKGKRSRSKLVLKQCLPQRNP